MAKKIKKIKNRSKGLIKMQSQGQEFYVSSELADDEMIEREMMGEILPHFIYEYCDNKPACSAEDVKNKKCLHRKVTGLSVKGVNEVVRRLNKNNKSGSRIRINPEYIKREEVERDGEKGMEISVFGEDLINGNSAWGIKFEAYSKTGKNGLYKNTFAVEKALSKAERNAKRKLISETLAVKMIQKLIAESPNTIKYLEAPQEPVKQSIKYEDAIAQTRKRIEAAKSVAYLINLDEKIQQSKFKDKDKEEFSRLTHKKADELQK